MLNLCLAFFSSVGFIFLFNNYVVFNITDYFGKNTIDNRLMWGGYKLYAFGKLKTVETFKQLKQFIHKRNLCRNILLISNGERINTISFNEPKSISEENAKSSPDLIILRNPSTDDSLDYDLIRIDNLNDKRLCPETTSTSSDNKDTDNKDTDNKDTDNKDTDNKGADIKDSDNKDTDNKGADIKDTDIEKVSCEDSSLLEDVDKAESSGATLGSVIRDIDPSKINYKPSKQQIHAPVLILNNVEEPFDLSLDEDNYYIVGNKIFDTAFVKWILFEKHNIRLTDEDTYKIKFFDADMSCKTLEKSNFILIGEDKHEVLNSLAPPQDKLCEAPGWGLW